jgi:hypothetical protein
MWRQGLTVEAGFFPSGKLDYPPFIDKGQRISTAGAARETFRVAHAEFGRSAQDTHSACDPDRVASPALFAARRNGGISRLSR